MARDKQYKEDSARLAALIEKYTNIPQEKVYSFIIENTAENLLPFSNKLCKNAAQRQKLNALFEFKNLYEIVKGAENRAYQLNSTLAAKEYFKNYFADANDREHFAVAYIDPQLKVIKTETVTNGTVEQAHVYPREILKEALFMPLYLNSAVPEDHKNGVDMSRELLRRSRVLVVCGRGTSEDVKDDIATAARLGITATTLDDILTEEYIITDYETEADGLDCSYEQGKTA